MISLPNSITAEQGLIGSVLLEPSKLNGVSTKAVEFFDKKHKKLWEHIKRLDIETGTIDNIILVERLKDAGDFIPIGGYDYLGRVQDVAAVASHSQYYAKEIREKYELRQEIEVYQKALNKCLSGESMADNVIAKLIKEPEVEKDVVKDIEQEWRDAKNGTRTTIPTPYPEMDRLTGGIRQGMVTIFTGRSKSGKSMFLSHWYNYLGSRNVPMLIVPLEDKKSITLRRMAANFGNYPAGHLDSGGHYVNVDGKPAWMQITEDKIDTALSCLHHVDKYPAYWWDRKVTPSELRGIAIRHKRLFDIQIMFIDGAKDLLRPSGKYGDVGFDEEISQQLCKIAEELNIAVVAVHHLTKISDDDRITVNNIRGSGNIVGDSRAVYALQSKGIVSNLIENGYDPVYDDSGELKTRIFECLVNNHGGGGRVVLNTDLNRCQFTKAVRNKDV